MDRLAALWRKSPDAPQASSGEIALGPWSSTTSTRAPREQRGLPGQARGTEREQMAGASHSRVLQNLR